MPAVDRCWGLPSPYGSRSNPTTKKTKSRTAGNSQIQLTINQRVPRCRDGEPPDIRPTCRPLLSAPMTHPAGRASFKVPSANHNRESLKQTHLEK